MAKRAAVILSGCGFLDGSEIHESVLSLLAMAKGHISYDIYALDENQKSVLSHLTKKSQNQERNIMEESARIARCEITNIQKIKASDYDLLWMPGGFGVALNLSDFGIKGKDCTIHPEIRRVIEEFYHQKKKIVAICIAPAIVAKVLEGEGIEMTLGSGGKERDLLLALGMKPKICKVDEICIDSKHHIYTAPGYMEPPNISGIYKSLEKIVESL